MKFLSSTFFPGSMRQTRGRWVNVMTSEEYDLIYDAIVKPSLLSVLPSDIHHLVPLSYEIEMAKSRSKAGSFSFKGVYINSQSVQAFFFQKSKISQQ
jgi:hypothetical protein